MANEYIVAGGKQFQYGIIGLSTNVFESISRFCLEDVEDIRIPLNTFMKKHVRCSVVDKKIQIELDIWVKLGTNINEISNVIQTKLHEGLNQMTDFSNFVIDINVKGFYL